MARGGVTSRGAGASSVQDGTQGNGTQGYNAVLRPPRLSLGKGKPLKDGAPLAAMPFAEYVWRYHCGPDSLPEDCHVHHRDFNKLNNTIANLQAMKKRVHMKFHRLYEQAAANSSSLAVSMWVRFGDWAINTSDEDYPLDADDEEEFLWNYNGEA